MNRVELTEITKLLDQFKVEYELPESAKVISGVCSLHNQKYADGAMVFADPEMIDIEELEVSARAAIRNALVVFDRYGFEVASRKFFPYDKGLDTEVGCVPPWVRIRKATVTAATLFVDSGGAATEPVRIESGAVIGTAGFGFARNKTTGDVIPHQHHGRVVIGPGVNIGANSCIDRGMFDDTLVAAQVQIDNLVHIAHNVSVGRSTCIAANTTICGHAYIGRDVWIGPNSVIKEGVSIGNGALIGAGSVVIRDVPEGQVWVGNPARYLRDR